MLSFKPTFSLYSFTFIKRLFSSSSLSARRVVSCKFFEDFVYSASHWFLAPFLEPILLTVCLHHSIKVALDLAKVNCPIQWSISVFSYLSTWKHWTLFASNHTLHLLRTVPPTSLASPSLPLLLIPLLFLFFKEKPTPQCWVVMKLNIHVYTHSLYDILSPVFQFLGFKWQLNLRNHKYKYFS